MATKLNLRISDLIGRFTVTSSQDHYNLVEDGKTNHLNYKNMVNQVLNSAPQIESDRAGSPSKLKLLKKLLRKKKDAEKAESVDAPIFRKEREQAWINVKVMDENEFVDSDAKAREALMTIIPPDLGRKRFQSLMLPKNTGPESLKETFRFLNLLVKETIIAEHHYSARNVRPGDDFHWRPLTLCPAGVSQLDWHLANLMILHNFAGLFYGMAADLFCKEKTCCIMSAGLNFEYMWCDGKTVLEPISVPARNYMRYCLIWIQGQLEGTNIINPQNEYTNDAAMIMKTIARRVFRVYAHLATDHWTDFQRIRMDGALSAVIRRLVLYLVETGMLGKKEMEPIREQVKRIKREFRVNGPYE